MDQFEVGEALVAAHLRAVLLLGRGPEGRPYVKLREPSF